MKLPIEEFLKRRKESKPAYVFDLRAMEEYEKDHLAGAYNLPFEQLEANMARLPYSGDMLFYDGGEGVVAQTEAMLEENGFSDYGYVEEGLEQVREALKESPYDSKWSTS